MARTDRDYYISGPSQLENTFYHATLRSEAGGSDKSVVEAFGCAGQTLSRQARDSLPEVYPAIEPTIEEPYSSI